MNFPKGSKNEVLLDKFDNLQSKADKLKQLRGTLVISNELISKCEGCRIKFDTYKSKVKPVENGGDLRENFIDELKRIDHFKNVLSKHRIKTSDVPNISQYGNEQVQNQVRVEEVKINLNNIKPMQTPNVKKSDGCCSIS